MGLLEGKGFLSILPPSRKCLYPIYAPTPASMRFRRLIAMIHTPCSPLFGGMREPKPVRKLQVSYFAWLFTIGWIRCRSTLSWSVSSAFFCDGCELVWSVIIKFSFSNQPYSVR